MRVLAMVAAGGVLAGICLGWWVASAGTAMWRQRARDKEWAGDRLVEAARKAQQRLRFQTVWRATTGAVAPCREAPNGLRLPLRDSGPAVLPAWARKDKEPDWEGESFSAAGAPSPRWVAIGEEAPTFVPPEWEASYASDRYDDTLKLRIPESA